MPVRKLNYTNRKSLGAEDIPINIVSGAFEINLESVGNFDLPSDSLIIVEPYKNVRRLRVPYGTVGNPETPPLPERSLGEFSEYDNVLFRIKIVEKDSGKILAETNVHPHIDGERPKKSLLPVDWEDNVEGCWRVDFEGDPMLIIDREIGRKEKSNNFLALVYPAVLREILTHILIVEEFDHTDDDDHRFSHWLRFGKRFASDFPDKSESGFQAKAWEWINNASTQFAKELKSLKIGKTIFSEE